MIARRKSRYLLVESSRQLNLESKEEQRSLAEGIAKVIGESGYMNASPKVMRQVGPKVFIIRAIRGEEPSVILALSFIKQMNNAEIGFYTIRNSGSISKLEEVAGRLY